MLSGKPSILSLNGAAVIRCRWMNTTAGYYDNDYVNIRNITVGYTLPERWMGRIVKKTRFYFTMNDPWGYSQFRDQGGISWWESYYIFGASVQF